MYLGPQRKRPTRLACLACLIISRCEAVSLGVSGRWYLSAIGGLSVTHRFLPLPRSRIPTRHISLERGLASCTLSHNQLTGSQLTSCIIIIEVAWYHSHQLPTYRHFHLALVTPIHETTQHLTPADLLHATSAIISFGPVPHCIRQV
jgi:hypothetical protein